MEEVSYPISESLEIACTTCKDLQKAISTGMSQLKQIKTVDNDLSSKWPSLTNNAQMVLQVSKEQKRGGIHSRHV